MRWWLHGLPSRRRVGRLLRGWLAPLSGEHAGDIAYLAQDILQFLGVADFEDSIDDRAFGPVARHHLHPQHIDLRRRDHASHIAQQPRPVGALDDDWRAERLAAIEPRPTDRDAAFWLAFQHRPQIRAVGAMDDHATAP